MTHNANIPTSEVLNLAADLIEERGWGQGSASWSGMPTSSGRLCLEGGIQAALGFGFEDRCEIYNGCPAYEAVARHVGLRGYLFLWNDKAGRTASEVIEVLRATAVIEQAREDAALLAEMGRA